MAVAVMAVIAGTALDYIYAGSSAGTSELMVNELNHHAGLYSRNSTTQTTLHKQCYTNSTTQTALHKQRYTNGATQTA
jgi:hypothetical protein